MTDIPPMPREDKVERQRAHLLKAFELYEQSLPNTRGRLHARHHLESKIEELVEAIVERALKAAFRTEITIDTALSPEEIARLMKSSGATLTKDK